MSKAIQLFKPRVTSTRIAYAQAHFADYSSFEPAPEPEPEPDRPEVEEISQLRLELKELREQLFRTRRALVRERLMRRNAIVREMDLREALVRRIFQEAAGD